MIWLKEEQSKYLFLKNFSFPFPITQAIKDLKYFRPERYSDQSVFNSWEANANRTLHFPRTYGSHSYHTTSRVTDREKQKPLLVILTVIPKDMFHARNWAFSFHTAQPMPWGKICRKVMTLAASCLRKNAQKHREETDLRFTGNAWV